MMDVLRKLAFGFEHALTWQNLMFCAIGCTVGTLVGLLPGLGPLATISLLLPLTYSIPTGGALIMLAGIHYGAQYGDSVSAITMKIPHASSIVACIDGYQMTLSGKTRLALFTAGVSSFIGGRWPLWCCRLRAACPLVQSVPCTNVMTLVNVVSTIQATVRSSPSPKDSA